MPLNLHELRRRLEPACVLEYHDVIGSTNDRALELARQQAPAGTVVVADMQTAGRGRRGTVWTAPAGGCVLVSLLARPASPLPPHHLAILTGVGVANGLRAIAPEVKIKWPNDLMLADRKVAGILVEATGEAAVIGVGINCTVPSDAFPDDLRERAGSLHALTGRAIAREEVLARVLEGLTDAFRRVEVGGIVKMLIEWNTFNWLSRRKVRVTGPLGAVDGDGLFLDGRRLVFHVFKDGGVVAMPLASTVEAR